MPAEADESGTTGRVPGAATALSEAARRHRALAEPVRLRLLQLIGERGRSTVHALASAVHLSDSTASRHLALLDGAGLIDRMRRGTRVVCRLTKAGAAAVAAISEAAPTEENLAASLSSADPEEVRFYLTMGTSLLPHGGCERAAWDSRMVDLFGPAIEPHLTVLHEAVLRCARGAALDGLPLPADLIREDSPP